ncbi:MAG: hypothetical protein QOJ40_1794, partial [Verrucomicrobiota bacterium]
MEDLASVIGSEFLLSETAAHKLDQLCKPVPEGVHSLAGFDGNHSFFSL